MSLAGAVLVGRAAAMAGSAWAHINRMVCRQKECQVRDLVLVQARLPLGLLVAFSGGPPSRRQ